MITPDKHTNLRTSVLFIAGLALAEIQKGGCVKYDDLRSAILAQIGQSIGDNFEYALCFLFLIDKIQYLQNSDSFTAYEIS